MSNLDQIPLQEWDFRTNQLTSWTDGFPIIGRAGAGGIVAGAANVGTGSLAIADVAPGTQRGAHGCLITGIQSGLSSLTVTDPDGDVTAEGVVGLPLYAGGLTLTVNQGATPFAAGDAFAVSVLWVPVDITGLVFGLRALLNTKSATRMLEATSDGVDATMPAGTTGGQLAMRVPQATMSAIPPGDYPYSVIATDRDTGLTRPAFIGTIRHRSLPSLSD